MDFTYDEGQGKIICEGYSDDICTACPDEIRNRCPLLLAISNHIVYPAAESLIIEDCSLYQYIKKLHEGM